MFKINLVDHQGQPSAVFYDQHTSKLVDENGVSVITDEMRESQEKKPDYSFAPKFVAISPDEPGKKVHEIKRLKIQLGLGCNYSCSYCLQGSEVMKAVASSTNDTKIFLANIDKWLYYPEGVERIEIWGGEPLLYWHKVKALIPGLKEKFPDARYSMITNGTLLTEEITDQLYDWGFHMSVSDDPFTNPEQYKQFQYIYSKFGTNMSFNAVLTPKNCNMPEIVNWFHDRLPGCNVQFEGVVHSYDGGDDTNAVFTIEKLQEFSRNLTTDILTKRVPFSTIGNKLKRSMSSMIYERPSDILFQKCGMDTPDSMAVDLLGNVMTCQNVGANGPHKIGTVQLFDKIALDTSTHWSKRAECQACPVLQLCQGACMYQEGDNWVNSCNAEYYYNMAYFMASIAIITGKMPVNIEGEFVRPVIQNTQPSLNT
jgi:uncharacterized protein